MRQLVFSLVALILSLTFLVAGNSFLTTLIGVRLSLEAYDPGLIGRIMVFNAVGFVAGTLYADRIVQRVGHIRSFAVFCAILAMVALTHPIAINGVLWSLLRVCAGFVMAGLLIVVESWFSAIATNDNRATIFSVYQICFYLAGSMGQLLIMGGDPRNYFLYSVAAMLLIAALIPLSLTRMQGPPIEHIERLSLKAVFAVSPLGLIAGFISGMILSAFYTMSPVYTTLIGFEVDQIAWFMSVSVLTAMLMAWPIAWLCDRMDRAFVMLLVAASAGTLSLLLTILGQNSFWIVTPMVALFIGIVASLYPISAALIANRVDSHQMVSASATLLLSFGIGSCFGPLLSSYLIEHVGANGMFLGNTVILFILVVYTRYRLGQGLTVTVEEQEDFVSVNPGASPVITELDPRSDAFEDEAQSDDPDATDAKQDRQ